MDDLFGGDLVISDGFSNTLNRFRDSLSGAGKSFSSFTSSIGVVERANRVSIGNMESDMKRYSDFYVKQGYTMNQAMSKAASSITREVPTSGNAWVDALGKIKQVGIDAFDNIGQKMESFSNSTLGTITKVTAGFISLKAGVDAVKEGLTTGMEYQNLRLVLDNLYKSPTIGAEKFKMGTDFAASSIWQERDVIKSLSMLKGSGLDDSKSNLTEMSDLGSYAKAMGVGDISTATRAYSEMMMGRWNMMTMDLSINREEVENYAKQNHMKSFDTANGKVTDKSALDEAFKGYIASRGLTGLTDKMGQTATGKLSTFMDNFKKSLADLIGITSTGEVREGSLFDKFTQGLGDFTTKIQEFSKSENFNKLSDMITGLGNGIYSAFSFVIDHPELAGNLIKLSAGLWVIGKIGSFVTAISSIGALFAEGGALAGLGAVLLPLAGPLAAIVAGFMLLSSALAPDGLLNQGIGWLLGELFGEDMKKDWQDASKSMNEFFAFAVDGWKVLLGLESSDELVKKYSGNNAKKDTDNSWSNSNIKMNDTSKVKYKTASDMVKNGDITKNSTSSHNSKTEVNVNIAKVEKTADVDELMDTVTQRMDKYNNTRNNLN